MTNFDEFMTGLVGSLSASLQEEASRITAEANAVVDGWEEHYIHTIDGAVSGGSLHSEKGVVLVYNAESEMYGCFLENPHIKPFTIVHSESVAGCIYPMFFVAERVVQSE